MWRAGYRLLLWLAFPFVLARLWWRGRHEPGYRQNLAERFGFYPARAARPVIWLRAVSVGETRAAEPLLHALRSLHPDCDLLITQMTATGREAAQQLFGGTVLVAWLAYDYPSAVRRFLRNFRPRLGILMETEIWFHLVGECQRSGVPLLLANARMSAKSARSYAAVAPLVRVALGGLSAVAAQTTEDAERLRSLGAQAVEVTGNLKFDAHPSARSESLAAQFRHRFGSRAVLLAASTREGEEDLLLDALEQNALGDAILVIVPRHPQRFDTVAQLLASRGLKFIRRSADTPLDPDCDIVFAERPRGGLQLEAADDRVVARLGQITQRAVDLLLGVQDVDVDTHPDLVAELVRVERAAAGDQRRLQGFYLRHPVAHPDKSLTSGQRGGAPRAFEILLRLFPIRNCLPHLRADIASGIQGNGKLQADRATGRVRRVVVDRSRGADARRALTCGPDDVQGGQVPRADALDLARSDFKGGFLRACLIALVRGGCPVFHRIRLGRIELDTGFQWLEPLGKLADNLLQGALLDFEVALCRDLLRRCEVVSRLRFVRIGDRRGAHLEISLRLSELLGNRYLLCLDEGKAVLRGEHVEIGLRDAHDQILGRLAESGFGLCRLERGRLVHLNALPIEKRLRES